MQIKIGSDDGTVESSDVAIGDIVGGHKISVQPASADSMTQKEGDTLKELGDRLEKLTRIVESLVVAVRGNQEFNISGILHRLVSVEILLKFLIALLIVAFFWLAKLTFS